MCGIVGYIGDKDCFPILIKGLQRLEYRGYDSAGVAVFDGTDAIQVRKKKGKVEDLAGLRWRPKFLSRLHGHRTHPMGHARAAQ